MHVPGVMPVIVEPLIVQTELGEVEMVTGRLEEAEAVTVKELLMARYDGTPVMVTVWVVEPITILNGLLMDGARRALPAKAAL